MRVALKIDVNTLEGAIKGVPNLLKLFSEYQIKATFFFSFGFTTHPSILGRIWRGLKKQPTDSSAQEEVVKIIRTVIEAGHEIGLQGYDYRQWVAYAAHADRDWTRHQLALGLEAFEQAVGHTPAIFAAAEWQLNPHLLALEEKMGFSFCSDTRGKFPFLPALQNVFSDCPQIPTTLPTLDELLQQSSVDMDNVHEHLYAESLYVLPSGHVYSANAEREGLDHFPILEKLIVMWRGQEGSVRSLGDVYSELDLESLPRHQIGWTQVPGRIQHVAMQSMQVQK